MCRNKRIHVWHKISFMHKFLGGWWIMYFGLWSLMLAGILSQEIIKNIRQKGEAMVGRHQLTWFSFSSDVASHWFKDFPDFLCRFWHWTELKWLSKKIHYNTGNFFFFILTNVNIICLRSYSTILLPIVKTNLQMSFVDEFLSLQI